MKKTIYLITLILVSTSLCFADNFNTHNPFTNQPDYTYDKAKEINVADANGYYGDTASPPTVESVLAEIGASREVMVSDIAYGASWDGITLYAPSKNAIYDKIETLGSGGWTDGGTSIYPTTITDNVGIGTTAPVGLLQVGTSPSAGLTVLSSGNVGIGNTSPASTYRLEVTGNSKFSGDVNITGNLTAVTDQTVSGNIIMGDQKFIGLGTSPAGRLLFSNQGTDVLGFMNGNVGIGTTNTTAELDVSGTANATTLTEGGNAVYNSTEVPGGELGGTWSSPTVDATHSGSAHHSAVTLAGTPDYLTLSGQEITRNKLDISDDTNATGGTGIGISANDFTFAATELSALTWSAGGSAQFSWDWNLSAGDPKINFNNNAISIETGNFGIGITAPLGRLQVGTTPGTPLLIVQDGGNVGVGTSSPSRKLDINGAMISSDTYPMYALSIYNPDSSFDGIGKKLSLTDTIILDEVYTWITAGTNVIFTLKVGVTGTGPYTNLLAGSTATTSPLTVTSFVGGGTVPANQILILDTVSTSSTGTNTMYNLTVQTRKQR